MRELIGFNVGIDESNEGVRCEEAGTAQRQEDDITNQAEHGEELRLLQHTAHLRSSEEEEQAVDDHEDTDRSNYKFICSLTLR